MLIVRLLSISKKRKNIAFEHDFCGGNNHVYKNFYCRRNDFSDVQHTHWFGSCGCVSEYIRVCTSDFAPSSPSVSGNWNTVYQKGERVHGGKEKRY